MNVIKTLGLIICMYACGYGQTDSLINSNIKQSDGYRYFKYSLFNTAEVYDCYRSSIFPRQRLKKSDSRLSVEIDSEIEDVNGLIIKGKGFITTSIRKSEYPRWKEDFKVEIMIDGDWIKWRKFDATIGYYGGGSGRKRTYKAPTRFEYKIELFYANDGEIETQARVCFEYKKGKFLYSNPFDVKISKEQNDWIVQQNRKEE